ncbi:alpha-ketoglutarate-dependent dioxygenase AlkB [Shewanella sp. AS1]|uniref:alpha-ketoglutarate-dependent dioxygenase AlkB family protein n=1 Tax=Shewanella sp. AS1 TaxID=2907626 RepID=UPI001F20B204|nr:alpha-ketoglutarate-dependent dioxygenase AlkB [Shewanella sp. AS1]MCE9677959.1 alpha-ketoglutarate-dependent dioxygenase AlkB [Shewanella sp. AS1]
MLPGPDAPITFVKGYLNAAQQQALWQEAQTYPFSRPSVQVYGRSHIIPRSQVWFGDPGCDYIYSGLFIQSQPWPKYAGRLREKLARDWSLNSNGVLVNRYQDGQESMGWHSDDEPEISANSDIASITLGESRPFFLRHKKSQHKIELLLESGDLLLMHWPMQRDWQHALPKRARVKSTRLNYTYRTLIPFYHSK